MKAQLDITIRMLTLNVNFSQPKENKLPHCCCYYCCWLQQPSYYNRYFFHFL